MKHSTFETAPRRKSILAGLAGVGVAVALVGGLTTALHARVALTDDAPVRTPLTVATMNFEVLDGYDRRTSYLGLAVSDRKARLGFEVPGQISALPVRQGSPVRKGELIATLDDSALQARRRATLAELEQARAELELAELKADRQKDLRKTGAVSREAFDETRLRARALSARVDAVEASLASIDIELDKTRLLAPYDGLVSDHYMHEGAVITPGTPVVRLIGSGALEAHIGVGATRAAELEVGRSYALRLRDERFEAPLLSVRPDVDPVTRAATAVFAIPDHIRVLDGEPLSLELEEPVPEPGGWLPLSALLEGQRGLWTVLRVEARDGEYHSVREAVEILDVQGEHAYVRGTLPQGARVIASGVHRITPGAPVTPVGEG